MYYLTIHQVTQDWRYLPWHDFDDPNPLDPSSDPLLVPRRYNVTAYLGGYYRDFVPNQGGSDARLL